MSGMGTKDMQQLFSIFLDLLAAVKELV